MYDTGLSKQVTWWEFYFNPDYRVMMFVHRFILIFKRLGENIDSLMRDVLRGRFRLTVVYGHVPRSSRG